MEQTNGFNFNAIHYRQIRLFRALHYDRTRAKQKEVGDVTSTCLELVVPKRRGSYAFHSHPRSRVTGSLILFFEILLAFSIGGLGADLLYRSRRIEWIEKGGELD